MPESLDGRITMLIDCRTRCTLPSQDIKRAREFYERKLGLLIIDVRRDGTTLFDAGGSRIMVIPGRMRPSGHHTQLGFDVQDIRATIAHLEGLGIAFDDYPMPGFRTDGHLVNIAPYWAAWFRDSEGNSLAMWEPDSAPAGSGRLELSTCTTEANLPAHDMQRARRFYEERLGFSPLEEFADGGVSYEAGGSQFVVSPTTVKPSQENVQIAFETNFLEEETRNLSAAGIGIDDTVNSLAWMRAAAFRDSEGNLLSLIETV